MQYRSLPGWEGAVEAARRAWCAVPDERWMAVGDLEAPRRVTSLGAANQLYAALTRTQNGQLVNTVGISGFRRRAWEWFYLLK
jgi:hypothetical protein